MEKFESTQRWQAAEQRDVYLNPLRDCPNDIAFLISETRALTDAGKCGVKGCGQPLFDTIGCKEHAQYATDSQRLEARAQRLGVTKRYVRRHY
jgi:hypothetical protein